MSEGATARALRESLKALGAAASSLDKATVQLARRYATLLDQATPASRYRTMLDKLAKVARRDAEALEALERIRDVLGAHSVASDLGPKYLAVLAALGLTPAARGAKPTAAGGPTPPSTRDDLKARRDERRRSGTGADPR